jgi:hypothetical protein
MGTLFKIFFAGVALAGLSTLGARRMRRNGPPVAPIPR